MKKVLYISNEDRAVGGSSLSLLAMLQALKGEVQPVILFREDGIAAERFRSEGYECEVIPFNRATFHAKGLVRILRFLPHLIANAWIQARCVRKACKRFKGITAVHCNSGTVDIGLRIARAMGVPHIWHIREYLDLGLNSHPFPSWKHWFRELNESDCVIAISSGLFGHLGLKKHKFAVCLPDAVCSSADVNQNEEKEPYIAFVAGTISEIKRPDEAMRIFAASKADGYRLKYAGSMSSEMRSKLNSLANSLGIKNLIDFLPFQQDVKPLLSKASATLVCTEYEGMGRVAIEAMFCGCPVIARNSGGSKDVLEDGRYGKLYNSEEEGAAQLAETLTVFPQATVKAAREYAVNNYSIEGYGKKMMKIYTHLCD